MQELIKITTNDKGEQLVSGRELHEGLKIEKAFSTWIQTQLENVDAVENVDFTTIWSDSFKEVVEFNGNANSMTAKGYSIDYVLTLDIAKEICMCVGVAPRTNEETKKLSKEYRKYFINCEKKLKEVAQAKPQCIEDVLISSLQEMKALRLEINNTKEEVNELKEDTQNIRDLVAFNPDQWRKDTTNLINKIASKLGGYSHIEKVRKESYKILNSTYGVDVNRRLLNKKKNMALEGCSKSKIAKVNVLDVIAEDKKLIQGYVSIVSKMAIKYGI